MIENWLVCGTRAKFSQEFVSGKLDEILQYKRLLYINWRLSSIIEGCCSNSPDIFAENWAKANDIEIKHYPSSPGNYLNRNIEMVRKATLIIAFWDGFSYGTAHTIAWAAFLKKRIIIYPVNKG